MLKLDCHHTFRYIKHLPSSTGNTEKSSMQRDTVHRIQVGEPHTFLKNNLKVIKMVVMVVVVVGPQFVREIKGMYACVWPCGS